MPSSDPSEFFGRLSAESQGASVIPAPELQLLAEAVTNAHRLAREERVLTGYLVLYGGWLTSQQRSDPWAAGAVRLWRRALEEYKARYPRNWGDLD